MKLLFGIAVCVAIFLGVVALYARVLYLMGCCAGDLIDDAEPDLASVDPGQSAQALSLEDGEATQQKAHV